MFNQREPWIDVFAPVNGDLSKLLVREIKITNKQKMLRPFKLLTLRC